MDQREQLRAMVAQLCRVGPEAVGPGFSVTALVTGSITSHLLASALRKHLGIEVPLLHGIRTYAELESAVLGVPASDRGAPPPRGPEAPAGRAAVPANALPRESLACGLDVEKVSSLPAAEDYWAHEFYVNTFTSTEIAYCVVQPEPLAHFAARWCAKEALKKCDPRYLHEKLTDIEVGHDDNGAPLLQSARTQEILPYALSLTHAGDTAAAVVIRLPAGPVGLPPAALTSGGETAQGPPPAKDLVPTALAALALGLALFAALVAGLALWRS
jgi:phosphopantetheine--protein transferase-like protein